MSLKPGILVAPLEWGLGHATRCIPIIHELVENGCTVFIAAEGATSDLLKNEFPRLTFLPLAGYRMRYTRKKSFLPLMLFMQLPKMIFTIYSEHKWLKKIIASYKIDAIISDNRFGLYNKMISSVYITHQLFIKTGNGITQHLAQRLHYHFIKKYDHCWVPDFAEENALAGRLSHPKNIPQNVHYIGGLSRFHKVEVKKKYDLLVIISGPEPQRTVFEELLLSALTAFKEPVLFIRGLPGCMENISTPNSMITIINHLPAEELNIAIQAADMVVSRSGYTTVMDLSRLQKKAILIPTPGQTEQEYLADYLMKKKYFFSMPQKNFSLSSAMLMAEKFPYNLPVFDMEQYKTTINQFVQSVQSRNFATQL